MKLDIIEIKYKLHQKDIDTLLNKKIVNFKKLYPEYNDLKQIALNNDIMILQRKGDVIESFLP